MSKIPASVDQKILSEIKSRLNPDTKKLFLKLLVIHLLTAVVTLSICPQFGLAVFHTNFNMMEIFMKISPRFCDAACGAFFTLASMTSALIILSRDELRTLFHKKMLAVLTMTLSSIGFLIMLNPYLFVELTLLWFVGCIAGVVLSLEVGTRLLRFS